MEFIHDLLYIDTENMINEICETLKLDQEQIDYIKSIYLKKNYYTTKIVPNSYLYLSSNNKQCVCLSDLISKLDCASNH